MKKVFYSDLDGTLFNNNEKGSYITSENLKAINEFSSKSFFGIATGRNALSISKYFNGQIDININLPFVLMNGSCIYDSKKDKVIYQDILDKKIILESLNYIENKDLGFALLLSPFKRYHVGKYDENKFGKLSYEIEEIKKENINYNEIAKINFVIDETKYDEVIRNIEKFDSFELLDLIPASKKYVEIVNKGTSKHEGIKKALKYAEISNYKLYTIGDYINDFSMIKNADVSFAPENAHEELIKMANYKVSNYRNDAVSDALNIVKKL